MEEICSFVINNHIYTIYDVDKITGKENYVGRSHYEDRTVYIEKGNFEDMLLTLKHELMHVWLYENGHTNQDGKEIFDYEDVCELVALSNDSINRIVKLYLDKKRALNSSFFLFYRFLKSCYNVVIKKEKEV